MSKLGQILLFIGFLFLVLGVMLLRLLAGSQLPITYVVLGIGALCIAGAIFKDVQFFLELSKQRTTKHGMNLGVLVVLFTALLVGINYIGVKREKKFDLTKEKINSISQQTKDVLKNLKGDLNLKAFYAINQEGQAGEQQKFKDLTNLYTNESSKVKVSFIDPIKRPDLAKENEITMSGTVLLEYEGKKAKFEDVSEQGFTNAIIKITRDKKKNIYFIVGHGERDIDSAEAQGAQQYRKYLSDASYDIKTLNFASTQKVPEDADVLFIAGPQQPYLEAEITLIKDYLYKGGKLILALDPGTKTNLGSLADYVGVQFKNNYIIDPLGQLAGTGAATTVGMVYSQSSDITKGFGQQMTVFHLSSQVKPSKDKAEGILVEEVVKSSPASFTKADINGGPLRPIEGKDEKGPVAILISVTGKVREVSGKGSPKEFQAIVVGDSDFISNRFVDFQLNRDLTQNMTSYLAKDGDLVSIRPRESSGGTITLTQMQQVILFWGLIVFLPLGFLITGGVVWVRRRAA